MTKHSGEAFHKFTNVIALRARMCGYVRAPADACMGSRSARRG